MKVRLPSNMGKLADLQKVAKEMQNKMAIANEELDSKIYTATVAGGCVSVKISGKLNVQSVSISKDIVDPDDISILEDAIVAGVNEAVTAATKERESKMSEITGGFDLPMNLF